MSPTSLGINFIAASEKLLLEGTTSNSYICKSERLLHTKVAIRLNQMYTKCYMTVAIPDERCLILIDKTILSFEKRSRLSSVTRNADRDPLCQPNSAKKYQ